jgi:EAL domain-containing protein (putative c-di-GMP-specific phosphodiesterase class I)
MASKDPTIERRARGSLRLDHGDNSAPHRADPCSRFDAPPPVDRERSRIRSNLKRGITEGQFVAHYQPIVDAQTSRVVSMEALLRWRHPVRGLLRPAHFIAAAHRTGLLHRLDRAALRQATRQIEQWHGEGLSACPIAVNISADHFARSDLVSFVARMLEESGCAPEMLELELTEGVVVTDVPRVERTMRALRDMGIRLSIDDFGVLYASLSYLRKLPLNRLKLDRSFLHDLEDEKTRVVVRAMIDLAHELGLEVTAEGVETEPQAQFLRECGCDRLQGFLFERVLPRESAARWLQ